MDIPKDVQQAMVVPDWAVPMALSGYMSRLPQPPQQSDLEPVIAAIRQVQPRSSSTASPVAGGLIFF